LLTERNSTVSGTGVLSTTSDRYRRRRFGERFLMNSKNPEVGLDAITPSATSYNLYPVFVAKKIGYTYATIPVIQVIIKSH